jgi:uracil-DNA glycosylase family 4
MTTNLVLDPRQRAMLAEMGVRVWLPSDAAPAAALPQVKPDVASQPAASAIPVPVRREPPLRLPVLSSPPVTVGLTPVRYVIGNLPEAGSFAGGFDVVFLGEPCTGDAEKLLANMTRVLGTQSFVAQMLPVQTESLSESESLTSQLAALSAKVIVLLGPHSTKALLGEASGSMPFGKLRGSLHSVDGLGGKVVVTYHPLQLLRQPLAKAQAWVDLKLAMKAFQ